MAAKDMLELFQPMKIKLDLKADRPYFEIDGARTYLITEEGEISQNAIEALVHFKVEKNKYEKAFEKMREYLVASVHGGTPVQEGNRIVEPFVKPTTANVHAQVLTALLNKLFADDPDKIAAITATCVENREKKTILIDNNSA
jgi:hypothetical protein